MADSEYLYTLFIKTTPEKLWEAITNPEFTRQYWGYENLSDWKAGSKWLHVKAGDETRTELVCGKVLESDPPKRLVLSWVDPEDRDDESLCSRVTFKIETAGDMVRLDVLHVDLAPKMASAVSKGWPRVLSSLKTFLETGVALDTWAEYARDCD